MNQVEAHTIGCTIDNRMLLVDTYELAGVFRVSHRSFLARRSHNALVLLLARHGFFTTLISQNGAPG